MSLKHCQGCDDKQEGVVHYSIFHNDFTSFMAFYCPGCADAAENHNHEVAHISPTGMDTLIGTKLPKPPQPRCPTCGQSWPTKQEKENDLRPL